MVTIIILVLLKSFLILLWEAVTVNNSSIFQTTVTAVAMPGVLGEVCGLFISAAFRWALIRKKAQSWDPYMMH